MGFVILSEAKDPLLKRQRRDAIPAQGNALGQPADENPEG
jgi:hypothetical protein